MSTTSTPCESHMMKCLEVWGGNHAVDNGVVMAGLDAWLYSKPYRGQAAGGDIHYVSSCAAGMITRVLIADVSGHGEAVADVADRLRGLMRRYVNFVDQTRFVEGLNTEFSDIAEAGGFATAVAATYLGAGDQLKICNAGHPRPLWYHSKTRTWSLLTEEADTSATESAGNIPLGIAGPTRYDQFTVKLNTGDLVVLYTDSLTEARNAEGRLLGEQGLLAIARGMEVGDVAEFQRALLSAVERHGELSADDITVLILRPNGLKPRASMRVMARAMRKMMAAFFASLNPRAPEFPALPSGPMALLGRISQRVRAWRSPRQA